MDPTNRRPEDDGKLCRPCLVVACVVAVAVIVGCVWAATGMGG